MLSADRQAVIDNTSFWGHGGWQWHNQNVSETYGFEFNINSSKPIRYIMGYGPTEVVDEFLTRTRDDAGVFRKPEVAVVHWIGTDVMQALESKKLPPAGTVHFCDSWDVKDELATLGLDAHVVHHRPRHRVEWPIPMPDPPRLCVYMPPHRREFFRYDLMCDVERHVTQKWGWGFEWLDVEEAELNAGGRDVKAVLARCSHYLRCPIHDGSSHTAAEFIMAGRVVLTTAERPFQHRIKYATLNDTLAALYAAWPYKNAPAYYRWLTDKDRLYEALWDAWRQSA